VRNPGIFRCILQHDNGYRANYIGTFDGWSSEWHLVLRYPMEMAA